MKLILLGAPGAGKGTQAQLLAERLNIPSISTGNMLREEMAKGTELGMQVRHCMETGSLASDELVLKMLRLRLNQSDCENGFILDGVPRTLVQAEIMKRIGIEVDHVVSIEVDDDAITNRMAGRRVCPGCGASYHIVNNPPRTEGVCDQCGGELIRRSDDDPETVMHRLQVFHASTEVLKEFYAKENKLRIISGDQPIEDAFRDILKAIGETV